MVNKVLCMSCGKRQKVVMKVIDGENVYYCRRCELDLTAEVLERQEYLKANRPTPMDFKTTEEEREEEEDVEELEEEFEVEE